MDVQEIMRLLPHRYPFLLVDRVVECIPGKSIAGYKNVSRNEPFFAPPHGPRSTMPEMLVVEAMAQIAVLLTVRTVPHTAGNDTLFFFAGIDDAQFTGHVSPGERLDLESSVTRIMPGRGIGKFATRALVDGCVIASASMIAAMRTSAA